MAKEQTYSMRVDGEHEAYYRATTPNRALRGYFTDRLASHDGRYGRLHTGQHAAAMLQHGGRKYYGRAV